MNLFIIILSSIMPLVICSIAALVSEFTGRMVFFIDGLVTISAFIFYAFSVKLNCVFWGVVFAILIPLIFIFLISFVIEKFNFNYLIISLMQNIFLTSITSLLSVVFFGSRGVLVSGNFLFSQNVFKCVSILCGIFIILFFYIFLTKTKKGMYLRICNSGFDVLKYSNINPSRYKIASWLIVTVLCSVTAIILVLRFSSFVPGISSGIGFASLAIVFLGRRKILPCVVLASVFGVAQFVASNIQNIESIKNISSSVLISLPYLICILFIVIFPKEKE